MAYEDDGKFSTEDFESRDAINSLGNKLFNNYDKNDTEGFTPLCFAVTNSVRPDLIVYLVEKGATIYKSCNKGKAPLQMACIAGNADAVSVLVGNSTNKIDDETGEPIDTEPPIVGQYKTDAVGNPLPVRDENDDVVYSKIGDIQLPLNEGELFNNKNRQQCLIDGEVVKVPPEDSSDWNIDKITYKYDDEEQKIHSPMRDVDGNPIKQCDKNGKEIHKKDDSGKELRNKFEYIWDYEYLPEYQQLYTIKTCSITGISADNISEYDICEASKLKSPGVLAILLDKKYSNAVTTKSWKHDDLRCYPLYYATVAQCYDNIRKILEKTSSDIITSNPQITYVYKAICEDKNPYYKGESQNDPPPIDGLEGKSAFTVAVENKDVGAIEIFIDYFTSANISNNLGLDTTLPLYEDVLEDLINSAKDFKYVYDEIYSKLFKDNTLWNSGTAVVRKLVSVTNRSTEFINYLIVNKHKDEWYSEGDPNKFIVYTECYCYNIIKTLHKNDGEFKDDEKGIVISAILNDDNFSVTALGYYTDMFPLISDVIASSTSNRKEALINFKYIEGNEDFITDDDLTKIITNLNLLSPNIDPSKLNNDLLIEILENSNFNYGTVFESIVDHLCDNNKYSELGDVFTTLLSSGGQEKLTYILHKCKDNNTFVTSVSNSYTTSQSVDLFIQEECYAILNSIYSKLSSSNKSLIKNSCSGSDPSLDAYYLDYHSDIWPGATDLITYTKYKLLNKRHFDKNGVNDFEGSERISIITAVINDQLSTDGTSVDSNDGLYSWPWDWPELDASIVYNNEPITLSEGNSIACSFKLLSQPIGDVILTFSSNNPSYISILPSSLIFTQSNWDSPKNVTFEAISSSESDIDVTVTISSSSEDDSRYDSLLDCSLSITISNTTITDITLRFENNSHSEFVIDNFPNSTTSPAGTVITLPTITGEYEDSNHFIWYPLKWDIGNFNTNYTLNESITAHLIFERLGKLAFTTGTFPAAFVDNDDVTCDQNDIVSNIKDTWSDQYSNGYYVQQIPKSPHWTPTNKVFTYDPLYHTDNTD